MAVILNRFRKPTGFFRGPTLSAKKYYPLILGAKLGVRQELIFFQKSMSGIGCWEISPLYHAPTKCGLGIRILDCAQIFHKYSSLQRFVRHNTPLFARIFFSAFWHNFFFSLPIVRLSDCVGFIFHLCVRVGE